MDFYRNMIDNAILKNQFLAEASKLSISFVVRWFYE